MTARRAMFRPAIRRALLGAAGIAALVALFFLLGALRFNGLVDDMRQGRADTEWASAASSENAPPMDEAAGARLGIVLTGGRGRVTTGLQLLAEKRITQLLISGVGPGYSLATLPSDIQIDPQLRACCITLGPDARNTRGNALEGRAWVTDLKQRGRAISQIYIITSDYHMPRTALEFGRCNIARPARPLRYSEPDLRLEPVPGSIPDARIPNRDTPPPAAQPTPAPGVILWPVATSPSLRARMVEYGKYLRTRAAILTIDNLRRPCQQ